MIHSNPSPAYLIWCFIIALVPFKLGAQASSTTLDSSIYYIVEDKYPVQDLSSKVQVLLEENGSIDIGQILSGEYEEAFVPIDTTFYVLLQEQVVWLKLPLISKVDIHNWQLILHRGRNKPRKYITEHEDLTVYFVENETLVKEAKSGFLIPRSQKEIADLNSVNRVLVDWKSGTQMDIYLRIKDRDFINTQLELRNPVFPLSTLDLNEEGGVVLASFCALIIAIYTLFFFFYTRDWSYLYLFGMLLSLFFHYYILHPHGLLIDWFFPESPYLVRYAWVLLTSLVFVFFLQYGRSYADLKRLAPHIDRLVIWSIYFILIVTVIRMLLAFNSKLEVIRLSGILTAISLFLVPMAICIRLYLLKNSLIRYFVFSGIWLFSFSILGVLWNNKIIPFWDFPNPWMTAQIGFMLILALSLARKIQISERAKSEVEKVRAIDSIKSKFFANISHEFRTPLTLILGPVNHSLAAIPASEEQESQQEILIPTKDLQLIKRNAIRLENLVNQILDLSKLDQGEMKLKLVQGDIVPFIRAIVFSFESLAEKRHIHFRTHFPHAIESACFDEDKLEKILNNLLSNAFKFTEEHGEVVVRVEEQDNYLKILVKDSGLGMSHAQAEKVFDRFYQVESTEDQGTGIGLALVKELVELHGGQISVNSVTGEGTSFGISLPFLKEDFQNMGYQVIDNAREGHAPHHLEYSLLDGQETIKQEKSNSDQDLILIVEDNADLQQFIARHLRTNFRIICAKDGKEGIQLAITELPDLIISDVMMPKMNGLELCQVIKSELKTNHIPVILLTAKAGEEAKIEGLETGADDYLTKPFNGRELIARVQNLIEQRKKLKEKFASQLKIKPSDVALSSMDEVFLKQVMTEIEANLSNEYYTVDALANAVGFSRSQLHRKIKGLVGKTSNQLIREFRLIRAKELLEQNVASVSEIAYEVGYSNLSYFSKSYKETFGELPSETRLGA